MTEDLKDMTENLIYLSNLFYSLLKSIPLYHFNVISCDNFLGDPEIVAASELFLAALKETDTCGMTPGDLFVQLWANIPDEYKNQSFVNFVAVNTLRNSESGLMADAIDSYRKKSKNKLISRLYEHARYNPTLPTNSQLTISEYILVSLTLYPLLERPNADDYEEMTAVYTVCAIFTIVYSKLNNTKSN